MPNAPSPEPIRREDSHSRQLIELDERTLEALAIVSAVNQYCDDDDTEHPQRVGRNAALIAQQLGCETSFVSALRLAAPLHDIGKIGISRQVLLKPGPLTPAERENMMRHVIIGAHILSAGRSPLLRLACEIARTHHERWDGSGYSAGLCGEEIPLSGRITAVADVFDVLVHRRPHKPAWEIGRALDEMRSQAGIHFDPDVVRALTCLDAESLLHLEERPRDPRPVACPGLGEVR